MLKYISWKRIRIKANIQSYFELFKFIIVKDYDLGKTESSAVNKGYSLIMGQKNSGCLGRWFQKEI